MEVEAAKLAPVRLVPPALLAALVGAVVLYAAWRASTWGEPGAQPLANALALVVASLSGVAAAARAWQRCAAGSRTASAWLWITVAVTCLSLGYLANLGYQVLADGTPSPSIVDPFFLAFYVFFAVGLTRFPTRTQSRSEASRTAIDVAVVVLAAASVVWVLVLGPTLAAGGETVLSVVVYGAYPVADLLQIFGLTYVMMRSVAPATQRPLRLLAAGTGLAVVADMVLGWANLRGELSALVITDIAWMAAWACYILAAERQPAVTAESVDASARGETGGRPSARMPYIAPVVVLGLLIASQFGAPQYQRIGLSILAAVVATLVLLRQFLAQHDLIRAQGELSHQALHDSLTGLPNRTLVLDRAGQLLARARRDQRPVAALYIDVDGFKQVNDTFGHGAGDELLRVVAARLAGSLRGGDTVGRIGGDEFVVLLEPLTLEVGPELVAERLVEVVREPIELVEAPGRPVLVTASVGLAMGWQTTAEKLLRNADLALYSAKEGGKDRVAVFESNMQVTVENRLLLEMDLREALGAGQLFLVYQPTFDLQTECAIGVEALLRWRHPRRGVLLPDTFIGLAEETGVIVPIGRWVLQEACAQAAMWKDAGLDAQMSVNLSGRQLDHGRIVDDVEEALEESGLDAASLTLEVTESALMRDPDAATERLHALKRLGVELAIDDFGTGYSSLGYLRQFPVDALKIDRSFISAFPATRESAALVHTLIQLGKTVGVKTLGEGIEDPAQLRNLQDEGCDLGQGFLFAEPLAPEDVEPYLTAAATTLRSRS
jgi:diguanylate cyclase (GGDEF)-like protein